MTAPLLIAIPHQLGREEAIRRIKNSFNQARGGLGGLVAIDKEDWVGDRLQFELHALGQTAFGTMDVLEDRVLVEVTLPWLLSKIAERLVPAIRKQTTLLLEKK